MKHISEIFPLVSEDLAAPSADLKRCGLDVRAYYEAPDGSWQPTTKGLNIAVDLLPEFARLLADAQRTLYFAYRGASYEQEKRRCLATA